MSWLRNGWSKSRRSTHTHDDRAGAAQHAVETITAAITAAQPSIEKIVTTAIKNRRFAPTTVTALADLARALLLGEAHALAVPAREPRTFARSCCAAPDCGWSSATGAAGTAKST